MRFSVQPADPACSGCITVLAQGVIGFGTPDDLEHFLDKLAPVGRVTVEFDSPGGYALGAFGLGNLIRSRHLDTSVSRHLEPEERQEAISECYSACGYAFLGGRRRVVAEDASYGVHQARSAVVAPWVTLLQPLTGGVSDLMISSYIEDMGIETELLALANRYAPREMHVLSRAELVRYGVVTPPLAPDRWQLNDGAAIIVQAQDGGFEAGLSIACDPDRPDLLDMTYWRRASGREAEDWAGYMNSFLQSEGAVGRWGVRLGADDLTLVERGDFPELRIEAPAADRISVRLEIAAASLDDLAAARELWVFGDLPGSIITSGYSVEGWFPLVGAGPVLDSLRSCSAG
jgi:hypothetical protein